MKIKIILLSFSIIVLNNTVFSQQPDPLSFFPSAVGNIWEYDTPSGAYRTEILKDSIDVFGNHFLFYPSVTYKGRPQIEIDTSYNVYRFHLSIDTILYHYYKLDADSGECWIYIRGEDTNEMIGRVGAVYSASIFGKTRIVKEVDYYYVGSVVFKTIPTVGIEGSKNSSGFIHNSSVLGDTGCFCFNKDTTYTYESTVILVEGIGEYYEYKDVEGPQRSLRGAVINGDTLGIITSINENIVKVPKGFELYQNYPNPFNPSTKIKYEIPNNNYVSLKVYDILGRQVSVLVNEYKNKGVYEYEFNAAKYNLSSGIYIAVLKTKEAQLTRSMLLIK